MSRNRQVELASPWAGSLVDRGGTPPEPPRPRMVGRAHAGREPPARPAPPRVVVHATTRRGLLPGGASLSPAAMSCLSRPDERFGPVRLSIRADVSTMVMLAMTLSSACPPGGGCAVMRPTPRLPRIAGRAGIAGTNSSKAWSNRLRSASLRRPNRSAYSCIASRTTSLFGLRSASAVWLSRVAVASSRLKVILTEAILRP